MYELVKATEEHIPTLIRYKQSIINEHAKNLEDKEKQEIKEYVYKEVTKKINKYKIIMVKKKVVGDFLFESYKDGKLLDEIYLEKEYRNLGIGSSIIMDLINKDQTIYLWVYKLNEKAIRLYQKLGFEIVEETKSRYCMRI